MKNFTRIWMTALMLTATFLFAQSTQSNACSIAGTASATKDSICVSGTTTLNLTGYLGAIQWQSFDGTNWVAYTANTSVPLDENGELLVRVAIGKDPLPEGGHDFTLTATSTGTDPATGTVRSTCRSPASSDSM